MKRFVVPPNWPTPPGRSWVPPKTWRPDPSWPPAPEGWRFWVDGKGNPVRGPFGQYGAPSRRVGYAGAGALVLFLGINVWAASTIGLFDGKSDDTAAVKLAGASPSPGPASTSSAVAPVVPPSIVLPPELVHSVPMPTLVPTVPPTARPTQPPAHRPTSTRTSQATRPKATRTTTTDREKPAARPTRRPTVRPTARPTARPTTRPTGYPTMDPSTRAELMRQYCIDRGIDPSYCDPNRWQTPN
ncbi:PT domain-containing protein [Kribbella solani]|uniref:PT domain-containing protein n=1 Tax=Kribbella solani TaxID=236067 RepID=UPI0029A7763E|nr:PT domain-containing protein [Kribbella solani]MDX2970468.1 PT domain-containing protein [Kribbella solani]